MADTETANPSGDTVVEGNEAGSDPVSGNVGDKEANKTPSSKPDQDEVQNEVAPPLITVSKGTKV